MALPSSVAPVRTARDDFERHYAEKIWELIPEIYRHEDGISGDPDQLRALVQILANHAAIQRRSIDRLLADSRIAEADDWAITYIGQLLGTRFVHPLNSAGRRADVAETLAYRRRAGTPRLFDALARDIADWDAVTQEAFRHLMRFPHGWEREFPVGPVTGTPRGGFPHMRRVRIGDTAHGPFEDLAHRPEFRRGARGGSRYNIPKVTMHCFRKEAFDLSGVTPFALSPLHYTFDPSGRGHVPLFQRSGGELSECAMPAEWDVRMPISCRRLNAGTYRIDPEQVEGTTAWAPFSERTFDTLGDLYNAAQAETAFDETDVAAFTALADAALEHDTPKWCLLEGDDSPTPSIRISLDGTNPLSRAQIVGGGLEQWSDVADWLPPLAAVIDPRRGLLQLAAEPEELSIDLIHYGALWSVGAGTRDRPGRLPDDPGALVTDWTPDFSTLSGDHTILDSATYDFGTDAGTINVPDAAHLWAENRQRPYCRIAVAAGDPGIVIDAPDTAASLILNGLWVGLEPHPDDVGADIFTLRLTGHWDRVELRDLTIDPGGLRAALAGDSAVPIPHVRLVIAGVVEELIIDRCVIGSIHEDLPPPSSDAPSTSPACSATRLQICDSIIHAHASGPAIQVIGANAEMDRCTVLGDCQLGRADISDSLIDGALTVQDAQGSCLRFSTVRSGERIPSPFECVILPEGLPKGTFESRRFGDPGYCVLTSHCPADVREGGEHRTEMGVFNRALFPIKRNDLLAKLAEFAPVQANVQLVFQS